MLYFTYFTRISNPTTIQTPKIFFVTLGTYLPSYICRIKDQLLAEIKKLWTNIFKHDRYDIVFIRFSFNKNVSRHANDLFFHHFCLWDRRHYFWSWDDPGIHQVRIQNGSMGPIMDRPMWTVPCIRYLSITTQTTVPKTTGTKSGNSSLCFENLVSSRVDEDKIILKDPGHSNRFDHFKLLFGGIGSFTFMNHKLWSIWNEKKWNFILGTNKRELDFSKAGRVPLF